MFRVLVKKILNFKVKMFQKKWFWRFNMEGNLIERPIEITKFWAALSSVESLEINAIFELNDKTFFFIGILIKFFSYIDKSYFFKH